MASAVDGSGREATLRRVEAEIGRLRSLADNRILRKMVLVTSLLLLGLLPGGCNAYPDSYDVYVASNVSLPDVQAAAYAWTEAVGVQFNIIEEDTTCDGKPAGCISIQSTTVERVRGMAPPGNISVGFTRCPDREGDCNIYLGDVDIESFVSFWTENYNVEMIEHEMGHAMGLEHHVGHFLMNPAMEGVIEPQCDDIRQYYELRHMDPAPCPT
jgi:hypothetical protein